MTLKRKATDHLIVFGRYPRVGRVKTRLIPALGPAGAATLQKRLGKRTLSAAGSACAQIDARLVFCYEGGDRHKIARWLDVRRVECIPQASGDLGRRMLLAMQAAFRRGASRVVLVGTDIPGLTADMMAEAFDRLRRYDLVLGPSTDGGYWLVGLSRPENIFAGIGWSSPTVIAETLELARRKAMTISLLDPLTDLDTPDDLNHHRDPTIVAIPYLSVIIPTLNEMPRIAQAIAKAASPDAEIIVSDGGSQDGTVDFARSQGARIVRGLPGRAGQQNRGAAAARGEVLLFLHADTHLPGNYVAHIFDTLMDRRVVLGAFRFGTDVNTRTMRWIARWTNRRAAWFNLPYGDQGLFMRRRDFVRIGGFPDVPIAEDLYLARAMSRRGRIALAPATATTSARRWQRLGVLRTTMINTIIAGGCLAGVAPQRLARLYHLPLRKP